MYQINFNKPEHIHFIGIGGISMSGLAEILLGAGFSISGSDSRPSALTKQLEERGAKVFYGQCAENVSDFPTRMFPPMASKIPPTEMVGSVSAAKSTEENMEVVVVFP